MSARLRTVPLEDRTVGVLERDDARISPGYTLLCQGCETYLIDSDGRVVHEWRSTRPVFIAYLLPNGNLVRDGSENEDAPGFQAGGAAGFVEEVTWDNERVWCYQHKSFNAFLSHHDVEVMPNGNILLLCWERKTREQAIAAGRRPELLPDGEMWNNITLEIEPDRAGGGAHVIWQWSVVRRRDFEPRVLIQTRSFDRFARLARGLCVTSAVGSLGARLRRDKGELWCRGRAP